MEIGRKSKHATAKFVVAKHTEIKSENVKETGPKRLLRESRWQIRQKKAKIDRQERKEN